MSRFKTKRKGLRFPEEFDWSFEFPDEAAPGVERIRVARFYFLGPGETFATKTDPLNQIEGPKIVEATFTRTDGIIQPTVYDLYDVNSPEFWQLFRDWVSRGLMTEKFAVDPDDQDPQSLFSDTDNPSPE